MLELIQLFQFENGGILIAEIIHFIQMFDVFNALMCAAGLCFLLLILHNVRKVYQNKLEHLSEITTCSPHTETLSILIVGGTKSGKTSTLKSLAGHGRHTSGTFSACPNLKYVRNDDAYGWKIFAVKCENERRSASDDCDDIQTFAYNLGNIVKFLDNFHVIVYCLPFQSAMTNESNEYIKVLRSVLGDSIFKRHVIFGFTHGDVFEETKHEKGFNNFIDWLYGMGTSVLKNGLKDCNNRGVLLHNKSANEETRKGQINNICSMCMDIVWEKSSLRLSDDYRPQKKTLNSTQISKDSEKNTRHYTEDLSKDLDCFNLLSPPDDYGLQRELRHSYVGHGSSSPIHPYYKPQRVILTAAHMLEDLKEDLKEKMRRTENLSNDQYHTTLSLPLEKRLRGRRSFHNDSRGHQQYNMVQSHFSPLKENFKAEEFTDEMHQHGLLTLEEKMDIDQMQRIRKKKDALFEAIVRHRNEGSVDVFLKILKEKYPSFYESWKNLYGSRYDSSTAHDSSDRAEGVTLRETSTISDGLKKIGDMYFDYGRDLTKIEATELNISMK